MDQASSNIMQNFKTYLNFLLWNPSHQQSNEQELESDLGI